MAKNFKKGLSAILAALMCAGAMSTAALAAYDQTGEYVEYGKTGIATGETLPESIKTIEDGKVTMSKSIEQTGDNAFDITLQVTTTEDLESSVFSPDAAMCLVFDVSNSMWFCKECHTGSISGSTVSGTHEDWCQYSGALQTAHGANQTRFAAAIDAAQKFADDFAKAGGDGARMLSIVFFCEDAWIGMDWTDVSNADALTTAKNILEGIYDNYTGTNHQAAFLLAENLLSEEYIAGMANKYAVVLTDGEPTAYNFKSSTTLSKFYVNDKTAHGEVEGINGDYDWNKRFGAHTPAEAAAEKLEATGTNISAIIYCKVKDQACTLKIHGTGETVDSWMSEKVTEDTMYSYDIKTIEYKLEDIVTTVSKKVDVWTVTDPMGDYIDYVGVKDGKAYSYDADTETLTWNLLEATPVENNGVYTYTLTYSITLDTEEEGFEFGKLYETNEATSLTYGLTENDVVTAEGMDYFNIPTVFAVNDFEINFKSGDASNISFMLVDEDGKVEFIEKIDIEDQTSFKIPSEYGKVSAVFVKQSTSGMFWTSEELDEATKQAVIDCIIANNPSYKGHNAFVSGTGDHDLEFKKGKVVTYTFKANGVANLANSTDVVADKTGGTVLGNETAVENIFEAIDLADVNVKVDGADITAAVKTADGDEIVYIAAWGKAPAVIWSAEDLDDATEKAAKDYFGADYGVKVLSGEGQKEIFRQNKNKVITYTFE